MAEVIFVARVINGNVKLSSNPLHVEDAPAAKRRSLTKTDAAKLYTELSKEGAMDKCCAPGFDSKAPMQLAAGRWSSVYFRNARAGVRYV